MIKLNHLDIVKDARSIGRGVFKVQAGEFEHKPEAWFGHGEIVFAVDVVGITVWVARRLHASLLAVDRPSVTN